mgnify:CR=1 FL=1
MREITLSRFTVELNNNIREIFNPRILEEVFSTHNIITIEVKDKENLAKLESFFKIMFLTKELYYVDKDKIVVYYINNSKFKEYNKFSKKKIKEIEELHKSYPNIKVYSDNSENITVDEVETVDLSLEKVLQYYYTKNKRKKAKNSKLMLSLLTNTGTLKDNVNLKEDNKELHSIVSYMLNEYPVEYNKKEVYWKDLSLKTKKSLLSRKVRVNIK